MSAKPTKNDVTWWWTVARFDGDCAKCGNVTDGGSIVAWNFFLKKMLCQSCGEQHNPVPSRAARRALGIAAPPKSVGTQPKKRPDSGAAELRARIAWAKPRALSVPCACGAGVGFGCNTRAGKPRKPHSSRVRKVAGSMAA